MSRHLASTLTEAFWQPSIWLPPNSTWSDIEMPRKAQFGHLAYPLPMAFILMVVRFFLDRGLYRYLCSHYNTTYSHVSSPRPIGVALGVKDKKKRPPKPNAVLEAAFQCGKMDLKSLCSDTGMSDRQISVWMRMRNHLGKSVLIEFEKFSLNS